MERKINSGLGFKEQSAPFDVSKLSEAIEAGYLSEAREAAVKKKVSFAPSAIGYGFGTCPRYWFMAFEGAMFDDPVDAVGIANMSNGSQAHERIQKAMDDAGILVAKEVKVTPNDPPIFGFIDAMVRIDGEILVGEIKTTRQESFIFRQNSMKPMTHHLYQVLIYLHATGKENGFLLYENKNDNTFLIIPVTMNDTNKKILEDALQWMRDVWANWESGTLPTRPFSKKSKQCKSCPLWNACWNETPDGEVTLPGMAVAKI